jgi:hypothetical protein
MNQLLRLAQLIGLNAVPGFGFFAGQWTTGTILALYWYENLVGSFLIAARIAIHRRLTHKRGHYVSKKATTVIITSGSGKSKTTKAIGTLMGEFLIVAIGFTLAEGLFLVFILGQLPASAAVNFEDLGTGVKLISALLVVGFVIDLIGIGDRPFFWIHRLADGMLSRVFVMFFAVFLGVAAIALFGAPRVLLLVFLVLKTFIDIASELPESQTGEATQWQLAIASLFGPAAKEKFATFARDANREYGTYQPEDELVLDEEARARLLAEGS